MKYKLKMISVVTCLILSNSSITFAQDKPVFVFTKKQDDARQSIIVKTNNAVKSKIAAKEEARIASDNKKTSAQLLVNEVKSYASIGLLGSGIGDKAESNSGSEASKYKGGGSFDINVRTGGFNFSIPFQTFAGLDFSLSKTTNTSLMGKSYFDLPVGLIFKGLPFVVINKGVKILNYQGNNYYIDSNYASADSKGQEFHSGLRYQSTEMFTYKEDKGSLNIGGEKIAYESYLEFINGSHLYFNHAGLMIAITDAFFINGQDQNYKHISRVYYKNINAPADKNRIDKVIDATGQILNFKYDIMKLTISYPKNTSGKSPEMFIFMNMVVTRFSDKELVGMAFTSDFNNLITSASDIIANNNFKIVKTNKIYQSKYGIRNGVPVTLSMSVENPNNSNEKIITHYSYLGDSNNGFKYGHDTTIDQGLQSPDFYNKIKYATTVSTGNLQTKHYFTYLHNEIKTVSSVRINGKLQVVSKQENKFSSVIKKNGKGFLKSTYQVPDSSNYIIYEKGIPVAKTKSDITYNAYGMPTLQRSYKTVAYDKDFGAPITTKTTTYDHRHMIPVESITTDNIIGEKVIKTIKLGSRGLLPIEKSTIFMKDGMQQETPKEIIKYQTDTTGLGDYHVAGLLETKTITDGVNTVTTKYEYYYNQEQNKLRTVETNDLGVSSESTSIDGSIISETNDLGLTNTFKFYDNGQPLSKTDYLGNTETQQTILMPDPKYKSQNIYIVKDIIGNEKIIGNDWIGNEVFSSIPNTQKTGYEEGRDFYSFSDDYPKKVKTIDKFGNYQLFFYDNLHRINKVESYTVNGKLMTTRNISQSNVCDSQYGCYVKVISDDGSGGVTTQYTRGKKILFEQIVIDLKPVKKIIYDYGDSGQLNSTITYDPNNINNILTTSTYDYGVLGNKIATHTYIGGMKFSEYYHFNNWLNKPTYSQYFANGRLIHTSYILVYNKYGNVQSRQYKVGNGFRSTKVIFDKYQRPFKVTDFNGNVETTSYNKYGQIETKIFSYPDGKLDLSAGLHFSYDNFGRQLTMSNIYDKITFLYTTMGAQLGEQHTAHGGYKATMTLNSQNDPDTFTDALGNTYAYEYDKSGRNISIKSNLGTIKYKYDDSNKNPRKRNKMIEEDTYFTNAQFKNNLTKSIPTVFIEGNLKKVWTYNNNGQQESLTTTDDKGNSLKIEYTYDNRQDMVGKIVTDVSLKDTLVTTYRYTYDDRDRLLSSSEVAITSIANDTSTQKRSYQYTYDDNGNILHELDKIESSNGIHKTVLDFIYSDKIDDQLVSMVKVVDGKKTTTTMKYDLNGNMTSTNKE